VALHALGATATAALFGAALGWLGRLFGAPWGRLGLVAVAAVAAVYALAEHPRLGVPVPQLRRQVPDWWRTFFGRPVAAALYGAGLGVGFLTYLAHGTLVAVAVATVATGRPLEGALVMAPFGLVRGLSASAAWSSSTPETSRALVDRLAAAPERPVRLANVAALLLLVVAATLVAARPATGEWWRLAAAALALAFGWAAATKLARPRRWRVALHEHGLPDGLERAAASIVPVAEAGVPALVVLGRPRAGAFVAVVLLAAFSVELLRVRTRLSGRVPCGCFGERRMIRVSTALARNAICAAVAALVVAAGRDAPIVGWPGPPRAGEVLPMLLATMGLAVAALTVWRASVWLSRGGGG
jgi:hypothetical protein